MKLNAGSNSNLTFVMDLYDLTIAYNYCKQGNKEQQVYFNMYDSNNK